MTSSPKKREDPAAEDSARLDWLADLWPFGNDAGDPALDALAFEEAERLGLQDQEPTAQQWITCYRRAFRRLIDDYRRHGIR